MNLKDQIKLKKLEFKKNREKEYIKMLDLQKKRKKEIVEQIEYQIQKQHEKIEKKQTGNKDTQSLKSSEENMSLNNISLESKTNIENGLEILYFTLLKNFTKKKMDFFFKFIERFTIKKFF